MVAAVLVSICLTGVICFVGFFSGYIFNVFVQNGNSRHVRHHIRLIRHRLRLPVLTMIKAAVFGCDRRNCGLPQGFEHQRRTRGRPIH